MLYRLACFLFVAVSFVAAQERVAKAARYTDDPRVAAILSEQRYLSGDGTFGAAYTQEDGVDFKEESDAAGNRRGSYSYVDPSGQRRTISYTAGKNGFVATGDHLPQAPAGPAAQAPVAAPAPRYNAAPAPRYDTAPQQFSRPSNNPNEDDGQYYPELYEREDFNQQRSQAYVAPQPQYRPQAQAQPQYSGVQQQAYSAPQPQPQYTQPQYTAPQPQYSGVQSSRAASPAPQQYFTPEERTQAPSRFFPPGKLDLNRSPDGYSYSFSSKV